MENMTAEDIKTMNNLLTKFSVGSWSLAWNEHGQPVLLPVELDMSVKSEILIKDAPPAEMENPKFNLQENRWEDHSKDAQIEAIQKLQKDFASLKNNQSDKTTDQKIDQLGTQITQLTQLFAQSMATKAGANNE